MLSIQNRGSHPCAEFHLVVEAGLSGSLFIEGWRDQARRLKDVVAEGVIVEFTQLTIKSLGDKAQWQSTDLDVYGYVTASTKFQRKPENAEVPQNVHVVLLKDLPNHRKIPHLINLAGVFVDAQAPTSTKAAAPAKTIVLADEKISVRIAVWKDREEAGCLGRSRGWLFGKITNAVSH